MPQVIGRRSNLPVDQAVEGMVLQRGHVYLAPPDRHMLVNSDATLSLTQTELVNFVRPSADLLFESVGGRIRRARHRGGPDGSGQGRLHGCDRHQEAGRHRHRPGRGFLRVLRDAVSYSTVRTHVRSISVKLIARSMFHAVVTARELELVT